MERETSRIYRTQSSGRFVRPLNDSTINKTRAKEEIKMSLKQDLQAAIDMIFGLKTPDRRLKEFGGGTFRGLYSYFTGDRDLTGLFYQPGLPVPLRASMDINSESFPNALANTLNRVLSAGYRKVNHFEDILISQKSPATSLRQGAFPQPGNWQDLPDIDPEAEDYPDMPGLTDASNLFDMLQKGCLIPIARRVVMNDDVGLLKRLMDLLGRVARKTHARYVWDLWISNANCNDGTAWFTSAHGNLGSDTISIAAVTAAVTALANMQEFGPSTDKLGLDLSGFKWHLIAPVSLWTDAVKINQTKSYYTANDLTTKTINPCYHLFGEENERIATPPFLTDTNDWGVVRDPEEIPIVEMQYLGGNEEPEIYFDAKGHSERAFKGDWFGLKARHEYGGAVSDYRSAYKSIVT